MPKGVKIRLGIFMAAFFIMLVAFYVVISVSQFEENQFFITAFTVAPALAIPAIIFFCLWMLVVLFELIQAWSEK